MKDSKLFSDLVKIKNDYNLAQSKKPANNPDYKPEAYQKKLADHYRGNVIKFGSEVSGFIGGLEYDREKSLKEIQKAKYPNLNSSDMQKKTYGAIERNTATLFLSNDKSRNEILAALRDSILMYNYDYASALLEQIINTIPADYEYKTDL